MIEISTIDWIVSLKQIKSTSIYAMNFMTFATILGFNKKAKFISFRSRLSRSL